jgi:hypothetical protein
MTSSTVSALRGPMFVGLLVYEGRMFLDDGRRKDLTKTSSLS